LVIFMVSHKILHKLVDHWVWYVWFLAIVLRYKDGDIRVMLVSNCGLVEIFVLKLVIPVACTYGEPLCDEVGSWFIYWLPSFVWRSGSRDG
jgi:hypothetical protein